MKGDINEQGRMSEIKVIDKDTFWDLLAEAKAQCGQDLSAESRWLHRRLRQMGPEQALRFHCIMHEYSRLAEKFGLWSAASILAEGCTDDGFIDFKAWLIAQGKEAYLAALKDPDALAEVEPYGGCAFEDLCYVGDMVYEDKTGRSAYGETVPEGLRAELDALKNDIVYSANIDFPMEWNELEIQLPKLCAKYLTPEEIEKAAKFGPMWNPVGTRVQAARAKYLEQQAKRSPRTHKKGGDAR